MDVFSKIAGSIKSIAHTDGSRQFAIFSAKVEKVEGETCTVTIDELPITDVRLRAVVNNNTEQLLIQPRVGSYVLVADLGELRQVVVIAYSEIDKIHIKIGGTTVDIDSNGVVFNGGALKGLIKIDAMVEWMSKLHGDLTALQTLLSTSPVAGNGAPLGIVFSPTTPLPQVDSFENKKIKQ
jgi:hypothetical protein